MKEEFDESKLPDCRDPLATPAVDFDWTALYARLGEDVVEGKVDKRLTDIVVRLLQVLVPNSTHHIQPGAVGLRLIALAWVINPAYFEGSPSISELAQRCGVNTVTLARYTGRYSRLMRWRNRGQKHAWNWRKRLERSDLQGIQGPEEGGEGANG